MDRMAKRPLVLVKPCLPGDPRYERRGRAASAAPVPPPGRSRPEDMVAALREIGLGVMAPGEDLQQSPQRCARLRDERRRHASP